MKYDPSRTFLAFSCIFLGGMVLLSLALAWLAGINPFIRIHFRWQDVCIGTVSAVAMLAVFSNARQARREAEERLGPMLVSCHWSELLMLALAVGFSEELLFRGVIEPWIARLDPQWALVITNVIFGAMHAVSLQYAVIAGLLGSLMSLLAYGPGGDNLLRPIVTHGVYDFLAFLWVVRSIKAKAALVPTDEDAEEATLSNIDDDLSDHSIST